MISVQIATNTQRNTVIVDPENTTVRKCLEDNNVNYSCAPVYLDGSSLNIGVHVLSFAQLGITEKCLLTSVVKLDNA